jgi:hypothetical protein
MPWEPKEREPTIDITIHLDKWVLLAANLEQGKAYLRLNFEILKDAGVLSKRLLVAPIFDPTDVLEVVIITDSNTLRGVMFYEYMDVRPAINILHDVVKEKSLANIAKHSSRKRPENTFIHPHPEPKEKDRDRIDLRRYWVSPDPIGNMREHDQHGLSDEQIGLATPEWLRKRR